MESSHFCFSWDCKREEGKRSQQGHRWPVLCVYCVTGQSAKSQNRTGQVHMVCVGGGGGASTERKVG